MEKHKFVPCRGSASCAHQRPHCQACGKYDDSELHSCNRTPPDSSTHAMTIAQCQRAVDHTGAHLFAASVGAVGAETHYIIQFGTTAEMEDAS